MAKLKQTRLHAKIEVYGVGGSYIETITRTLYTGGFTGSNHYAKYEGIFYQVHSLTIAGKSPMIFIRHN